MAEIGSLVVNLKAETAQFTDQMAKAQANLGGLKDKAGAAGQGVKRSMTDSREAVMLLGDEVGVHMPRALSMFVSKLPGVASAMEMAFPILGIVAVIGIIGDLIKKQGDLAQAIRKAADEADNQTVKEADQSRALELTNLKLDDQIAKLEHRPASNFVKEAILETANEIDHLTSTFATDFAKMNAVIETHIHWWDDLTDTAKNFATEGIGAALGVAAAQKGALGDLQQAMIAAADARTRLAEVPDGGDQTEAQDHLRDAYMRVAAAAKAAQVMYADDKVAALQFASETATATSAVKDLNQEIDAGAKKKTIAGLEQGEAILAVLKQEAGLQKILNAEQEKQAVAASKLAYTQAEINAAKQAGQQPGGDDSGKQKFAGINAERDEKIAAATAARTKLDADYAADVKAASSTGEEKKRLLETYTAAVAANTAEITQIKADANLRTITTANEVYAKQEAADQAYAQAAARNTMELAELQASLKLRADEQNARNQDQLHNATDAKRLHDAQEAIRAEVAMEVQGYKIRLQGLDKFDKDFLKQVIDLQAQIAKVTMKGQAEQQSLAVESAQREAMIIKQAQDRMASAVADNVARSTVMNKNLANSFRQTGEQMAEQMIKNLIMLEITSDKEKLIHAKNAYHKAFSAMSGIPPAPMWGYVAGAAAFASVMSFEVGGKIPGEGPVPITGHGGETVVTKALTDRVESAERNRSGIGGGDTHIHFAPQIHAVDATGVDAMLTRHSSTFQRHVTAAMRRANK
jgi:hypothetical protein